MLLRTIIATAAMQLLPFGAAQNLTLAYSAATLLSGGIDDCPTPLAAEDCRRGIASAMVVVRELRAAGRDVLFVPLADRQTAFVQMHPLTWGVNAVVFDYFNLPVYFTRHSMFTSRRDLSKLQARDTRTKPLVSNVLVSPADDWYGVPERAHVHNGIGIIWIGSASEPNSAPPVASAAAGLRDLHTRGVRATVIVYEDMIPVDDFVVALHGLLIVHPSIVVDTWTLSALRKVGNTFVIGAPGESSSYLTWLDVGFAMDGAVADVAFREVSLTLDDARKDAQYVADQEFLKVHANLAGSNDPVVGESPHVMPVGRIDGNNYCMAGECPQGNLFADGIAYEYGTDFAFVSSGGLRGLGWSPGNISISNLWETLPFANTVCTGALLGISIFELVNYTTSVAKYTSERAVVGADRLLHHSGLRVAVNPNLAPSRLLSLEVLNRATGMTARRFFLSYKIADLRRLVYPTNT
ncbi:hypothetical protein DIPPA_16715 [Diplonema papillatum]|nr:hypothetical protein DIPPA_16715 [Diplonema papillatum]